MLEPSSIVFSGQNCARTRQSSLRSWRDAWTGERRRSRHISSRAKPARNSRAAKPRVKFNSTLHQSSHGFATKTNALAREIPPATQARGRVVLKHPSNVESVSLMWDKSLFMVDLGLKGSPAIKNRKEALKILSCADILSSFLIGYRETQKERQRFILWFYVEGNMECDDFN